MDETRKLYASRHKTDKILKLGGKIRYIDQSVSKEHPNSYNSILDELRQQNNVVFLDQMTNSANTLTHELHTGAELLPVIAKEEISHIFAGIGTGGTISGISRAVKKLYPECKVIGADSIGSAYGNVFKKNDCASLDKNLLKIEGIGDIVISDVFSQDCIDDIIQISSSEALAAWNQLTQMGLSVGPSSGLAFGVAKKILRPGDRPLIVFPDSVDCYLNTD